MLRYKSNVGIVLIGRTPNIDYDYFTSTSVEIKTAEPVGADELGKLFKSCKEKLDTENVKANCHMDRFLALIADARPDWEITAAGSDFTTEMTHGGTSVEYKRKADWHGKGISMQDS